MIDVLASYQPIKEKARRCYFVEKPDESNCTGVLRRLHVKMSDENTRIKGLTVNHRLTWAPHVLDIKKSFKTRLVKTI